jgi:hypothetical protein
VDHALESPVLSPQALKKNFVVPVVGFVAQGLHTAMLTQHGHHSALIVRVTPHLAVLPLDAVIALERLNSAWEIRMGLIQYVMGNVSLVERAKLSIPVMWRGVRDVGVGIQDYQELNLPRQVDWRWWKVLRLRMMSRQYYPLGREFVAF